MKGLQLVGRDGIVMEQRNVIAVRLGSVTNKISLLLSYASLAAILRILIQTMNLTVSQVFPML